MAPLWKAGFADEDARLVGWEFSQSLLRDHWDAKPQRERDIWMADFRKTLHRLLALMDDGPMPVGKWGFPVRGIALACVAIKLGVPFPEVDDADPHEVCVRLNEIEAIADSDGWTLADSLKHYLKQIETTDELQQLKKPRDPKSARAALIVGLRNQPFRRLSDVDVAVIASVLLDDDAVDDRLVRRLTTRADS
ncbi:MAG: hypothetical protein KDI51_13935 [Xanthomonadales bacterium]|nr:hypothetical protein [Xanthomonadales bacterium]